MPFVAEAAPIGDDEADEAALDIDEKTTYTSVLRSSGLDVEESSKADTEVEEAAEPAWTGREGLGPVAHKVLWPQFVNQTSGLIDRALETENLFARIAQQKDALIEMGMVAVTRSLATIPAPATGVPAVDSTAEDMGIREVTNAPQPVMSDQARMDLMAMRARLSEDDESAGEIAGALEKAISEGMRAPLAQRATGRGVSETRTGGAGGGSVPAGHVGPASFRLARRKYE